MEQFVRTEIALHTFREDRYQPKARHILEKAKQKVEEKQLAENDRADAVNAFLKNYQSMMADL